MRKTENTYLFTVEKTDTGFSAFAEDAPAYTTAKSSPDLLPNIMEALNLYLEEEAELDDAARVKLQLDFQQFFQYYKVLNASYLAHRIGMNESLLSQYVKGVKVPSEKQLDRILKGIHEIGKELSEIHLVATK
ncbi:MAG: XRE family transcriptional regulator [Bacteroidota bacterium]